MEHQPLSVPDLISKWPSIGEFARDAGANYEAAKQMKRRGSIPVDYWPSLLSSDKSREIGLTADRLVDLHAKKEPAPEAEAHQ